MNELIKNIDKLHTTEMGMDRIKRNLSIETDDAVEWCKARILSDNAVFERKGKNWYVRTDNCEITVNAHSYTIITAHKTKSARNAEYLTMIDRAMEQLATGRGQQHELIEVDDN